HAVAAFFGLRRAHVLAFAPRAGDARLGAGVTRRRGPVAAAGALLAGLARASLVDGAIAVVVNAVARLLVREDVVQAVPPVTVVDLGGAARGDAALLTVFADPDAPCGPRAAIARLRLAGAAEAPLVDLPIAIVVHPVAAYLVVAAD